MQRSLHCILGFLCILTAVLPVVGCGGVSGSHNTGGPIPGESTTVAIQISSAANDQFIYFGMEIQSIALTNKAGTTTTIFSTPTDVSFIPWNGNAFPLATVTVPQDVYTSAAVTLTGPAFTYVFMGAQGSITTSTDAYGGSYAPYPPVVTLANPISVSGSAMGLTFSLQTAQSGTILGYPNQTGYTISPTFTLSSFAIPDEPASFENGKCTGLVGQVTAVAGNSMTVTVPGNPATGNPSLDVALNSSTTYQGIASASDLSVGTLVNFDLALQPDATYTATRVEVQDPNATDVAVGQLVNVDPSYNGYLNTTAVQQVGTNLSVEPEGYGAPYMYGTSAKFQTSALDPNLSALPFNAVFDASTLAAGQMVALASDTLNFAYPYTQPTSVTLLPQTIDAAVTGESTSGGYSVYTAQLAPYDLIVQMNNPIDSPPSTTLANPGTVQVYVDSGTMQLNATPLAVGGTFRFNGLLFNDSGTLRMVCNQVDDGVQQ
jgi:Domain of unknown function (DUF5666)